MVNPVLQREIAELRNLREQGHVADGDISFCDSLLKFYDAKNFLTEKQLPYFDKLLERARKSFQGEDSRVEEYFDGSKICALIHKAGQSLKYPSLRITTDEGWKIVLYRAGHLSRTPGFIIVTNGEKYPKKVVYGSIDLSGHGRYRNHPREEIKTAIKKIAANPVEVAKLSGQKYSFCCFCARELTHKNSLHHGYGPICAIKWGLSWEGPVESEEAQKELDQIRLVDLDTTIGEGEQT